MLQCHCGIGELYTLNDSVLWYADHYDQLSMRPIRVEGNIETIAVYAHNMHANKSCAVCMLNCDDHIYKTIHSTIHFDRPMKQNLKIKIEIKWLLTPLLHISGLPQHRSIFKGHRFIAQTSLAIDITKPTLGCTVLDRGRKWAQAWSHSLGLVWEQPWSWYN